MCTAMFIQSSANDACLGRTMDFSYPLHPELYLIPKGYTWTNLLKTHKIQNRYRIMGIGQDISPVTLAEGINEMGFAAAALYFPGYACYDPVLPQASKPPIAALELVNFLLGQCESVERAVSVLQTIRIVGIKDSVTNSIAPLHWILADRSGKCITAEKTDTGLHLSDNPIGVLSNSPDFKWHMANLRNYMNITPSQEPEKKWGAVELTPFGQGGGTLGLPGDYTPPSRFVRTAWMKSHAALPLTREETIVTCFHIMESVSIPKGAVVTARGTADYTQYTSFMNLSANEYFFKTYDNPHITAVKMPFSHESGTEIISLGKLEKPVVFDSI